MSHHRIRVEESVPFSAEALALYNQARAAQSPSVWRSPFSRQTPELPIRVNLNPLNHPTHPTHPTQHLVPASTPRLPWRGSRQPRGFFRNGNSALAIRYGPPCEQEDSALLAGEDGCDGYDAQRDMDRRDDYAFGTRGYGRAWRNYCQDASQWLLVIGVFAVVIIFYAAASEARSLTSGLDTAKINQVMTHITSASRNVEMATYNVLNMTSEGGQLAAEARPMLKEALAASNSLVSQMYSFSTHPSIKITSGFGQT